MDQGYKDGDDFPKLMDNNDPLGHFRHRFYIQKDVIYMAGNSLGLASKDAEEAALNMLETWKRDGVKLWGAEDGRGYLYSSFLANLMAPIVGADPEEIAFVGNTTTCIHQCLTTFYKPTKDKYKILVDDINFPTDRYAVDSTVRLHGYKGEDAVKVVKSINGKYLDEDAFIAAMTDDVALILLPAVFYRTAQVVDMEKVSKAAKEKGIIIGWDLCHGVGAIEIDLSSLDIDFAMWCTYKYLNSGPGAQAAIYINRKHFQRLPGLAGWFGNKKETQFLLKQEFDHQKSASGWQIGTPPMLSMASMEGSLKMVLEASVPVMRKKSLHITGYLLFLIDMKLTQYGFNVGNLREDRQRGGHVCLEHEDGYRISQEFKSRGILADFRDPNVIRLAPTALYTSYTEVYKMVEIILDIVKNETYKRIGEKRSLVV